MSARRIGWSLVLAAALCGGAGFASAPGSEPFEVTGRLSDAGGQPVGELEVALEASRTRFDVRSLQRAPVEVRRVTGMADAGGNFTLAWTPEPGFDHFELVAGLRVRKADGERLLELAREDITRRVGKGNPVVAALQIGDPGLVRSLRSFLASLSTDDERGTYAELGKPDQIDVLEGPGWTEQTWWYFELGRAAWFHDGRRIEVRAFDPIRRF